MGASPSKAERKRAHRRMAVRHGRLKAFALELGKVAGGVVLIGVALVISSMVVEYPVTDAVGAVEVLMAVVFGLGLLVGAFFLAGWAVLDVGEDLAIGWVGLLSGEVPPRFAKGAPNAAKAAAHAVVLVGLLGAGAALFAAGVAQVELQRAIEGLLLALAALVYGLGPLIPRLVYWRRHAAATHHEAEDKNPRAAIFMMLAVLGLGLAMGADTVAWHLRASSGHVVLPYGDWFERFSLSEGAGPITLELRPRRAGLVRVESYGCQVSDLRTAAGVPVKPLSPAEMQRRGVAPPDDSLQLLAFEAAAGVRYQASVPREVCSIRYRRHPGEAGEAGGPGGSGKTGEAGEAGGTGGPGGEVAK
jgi:hypothetical protein